MYPPKNRTPTVAAEAPQAQAAEKFKFPKVVRDFYAQQGQNPDQIEADFKRTVLGSDRKKAGEAQANYGKLLDYFSDSRSPSYYGLLSPGSEKNLADSIGMSAWDDFTNNFTNSIMELEKGTNDAISSGKYLMGLSDDLEKALEANKLQLEGKRLDITSKGQKDIFEDFNMNSFAATMGHGFGQVTTSVAPALAGVAAAPFTGGASLALAGGGRALSFLTSSAQMYGSLLDDFRAKGVPADKAALYAGPLAALLGVLEVALPVEGLVNKITSPLLSKSIAPIVNNVAAKGITKETFQELEKTVFKSLGQKIASKAVPTIENMAKQGGVEFAEEFVGNYMTSAGKKVYDYMNSDDAFKDIDLGSWKQFTDAMHDGAIGSMIGVSLGGGTAFKSLKNQSLFAYVDKGLERGDLDARLTKLNGYATELLQKGKIDQAKFDAITGDIQNVVSSAQEIRQFSTKDFGQAPEERFDVFQLMKFRNDYAAKAAELTTQGQQFQQQQINVSPFGKAQLKARIQDNDGMVNFFNEAVSIIDANLDQIGSGAIKFDRAAFNQAILDSYAKHNEGTIQKAMAQAQAATPVANPLIANARKEIEQNMNTVAGDARGDILRGIYANLDAMQQANPDVVPLDAEATPEQVAPDVAPAPVIGDVAPGVAPDADPALVDPAPVTDPPADPAPAPELTEEQRQEIVANNTAIAQSLNGKQVNYKGKIGTLNVTEGGVVEFETDSTIFEIGNVAEMDTPLELKEYLAPTKKSFQVQMLPRTGDTEYATVNGVDYEIVPDAKGNIAALRPSNSPTQEITNEQLVLAVEIERNKSIFRELAEVDDEVLEEVYEEAVQSIDEVRVVESIYSMNYTDTVESALDNLYGKKKLSSEEKLQLELWVFDALDRVDDLLRGDYKGNIYFQNAFDSLRIINDMLHQLPRTKDEKQFEKNRADESAKRRVVAKDTAKPAAQAEPQAKPAEQPAAPKPVNEVPADVILQNDLVDYIDSHKAIFEQPRKNDRDRAAMDVIMGRIRSVAKVLGYEVVMTKKGVLVNDKNGKKVRRIGIKQDPSTFYTVDDLTIDELAIYESLKTWFVKQYPNYAKATGEYMGIAFDFGKEGVRANNNVQDGIEKAIEDIEAGRNSKRADGFLKFVKRVAQSGGIPYWESKAKNQRQEQVLPWADVASKEAEDVFSDEQVNSYNNFVLDWYNGQITEEELDVVEGILDEFLDTTEEENPIFDYDLYQRAVEGTFPYDRTSIFEGLSPKIAESTKGMLDFLAQVQQETDFYNATEFPPKTVIENATNQLGNQQSAGKGTQTNREGVESTVSDDTRTQEGQGDTDPDGDAADNPVARLQSGSPSGEESPATAGESGPESVTPQFFFVGGVAAGELDGEINSSYQEAKQMVLDGKSRRAILRQTNWLLGMDNKLKYWIDNASAKFTGTIPDRKGLARSAENARKSTTLGDVFDFPQLYEAYPGLKNMGFGFYFDPINLDQLGVIKIDEADKSGIFINLAPKNNQYEKTIKEEVQHAIQRIEGYARGSSVGAYRLATDSGAFGQVRLADNNLSSREAKEQLANILYNRTLGEIEGDVASENSGLEGLREKVRSGPFLVYLTKDSLDGAVILNQEDIANFITDTSPDIPQSIVGTTTGQSSQETIAFAKDVGQAFPNIEIVSDPIEYDRVLSGALQKTDIVGKNGKILGYTLDGKVYIDPRKATAEVAIHEFGHIWADVAETEYPEMLDRGLSIIEGSQYEKDVRANYPHLTNKRMILKEALATAIGQEGAKLQGSVFARFGKWMRRLFVQMSEVFGFEVSQKTKIKDFAAEIAGDLMSGKPISEITSEELAKMQPEIQAMKQFNNKFATQQVGLKLTPKEVADQLSTLKASIKSTEDKIGMAEKKRKRLSQQLISGKAKLSVIENMLKKPNMSKQLRDFSEKKRVSFEQRIQKVQADLSALKGYTKLQRDMLSQSEDMKKQLETFVGSSYRVIDSNGEAVMVLSSSVDAEDQMATQQQLRESQADKMGVLGKTHKSVFLRMARLLEPRVIADYLFPKGSTQHTIMDETVRYLSKKVSPLKVRSHDTMASLLKKYQNISTYKGLADLDQMKKDGLILTVQSSDGRDVEIPMDYAVKLVDDYKTEMEEYGYSTIVSDQLTPNGEAIKTKGAMIKDWRNPKRYIPISLTTAEMDKLISTIDTDYAELQKEIQDYYAYTLPLLQETYFDLNAEDMPLAKASYYSPLRYEADMQEVNLQGTGQLLRDISIVNKREGFAGTKQRIVVESIFESLNRYMRGAENFVQMAPTVHNYNILKTTTESYMKQQGISKFNDVIDELTQKFNNPMKDFDRPGLENTKEILGVDVRKATGLVTLARFAFNVALPLKNFTGYTAGFGQGVVDDRYLKQEMGFVWRVFANGYGRLFKAIPNTVSSIMGGTPTNDPSKLVTDTLEEMYANPDAGPILARVLNDMMPDLTTVEWATISAVSENNNVRTGLRQYNKLVQWIRDNGLTAQQQADSGVMLGFYRAAKAQVLDQMPNLTVDEQNKEIARRANELMYITNQTFDMTDKSAVQLHGNVLIRLLTLYQGQGFKVFNTLLQSFNDYVVNPDDATKRKFKANMIHTAVFAPIYIATVNTFIQALRYTGDDERQDQVLSFKSFFWESANQFTQVVPGFVNTASSFVVNSIDDRPWSSPYGQVEMLESLSSGASGVLEALASTWEEDDKKAERAFDKGIATAALELPTALGLPREFIRLMNQRVIKPSLKD